MNRRFIRSILRAEAERKGINPAKYVHWQFDKIQIGKYGIVRRLVNIAKGTHVRSTWHNRINIPT